MERVTRLESEIEDGFALDPLAPPSGSSDESTPGSTAGRVAAGEDVEMEPALEHDPDHTFSREDEPSYDDSAFAILQSDISNYLQAEAYSNTVGSASSHAASASAVPSNDLPPAVARYRRPETQDPTNFWYCDLERWNTWLVQAISEDKKAASTSAVALRSFHLAGLLMETDEGIDAETPCNVCARQSKYTPCRIYANKAGTRCAYCINKHKSHCFSGPLINPRGRGSMVSDVDGDHRGGQSPTQSIRGNTTGKRRRISVIPEQLRSAPQTGANRRPETTNPSDFWYVSKDKWEQWSRQASGESGDASKNSARASMRLSSRAGIVMESSDSHNNDPPCALCKRAGMVCKVLASEVGRTCAYCTLRRAKCSNTTQGFTDRDLTIATQQPTSGNTALTTSTPQQHATEEFLQSETPSRFRRPQTRNSLDFWFCSIQKWDELHHRYATALIEGRETAYRVLQLLDKAGRLMETPEGVDAEVPCDACTQSGVVCKFSAVGRKPNERCAFCKLKYKKCNIPEGKASSSHGVQSSQQVLQSQPSSVLIRSDVPHLGSKRKRLEDGMIATSTSTLTANIPEESSTDHHFGADDVVGRLESAVSILQQQVKELQARDTVREAESQKQSKRVKLMAQNLQRVGSDLSKGWKRFLRDEFPDDEDDDEQINTL